MGVRGPKSRAGLPDTRAQPKRKALVPPADLTETQAAIWRSVLASRPADWFDAGSAPLLAAYARAVDAQATLGRAIDALDPKSLTTAEGSAIYRRLTVLAEKQAGLAIKLATAMRLSQQSRRSADAASTAARRGRSAAALWGGQ